MTGIAEYGNYDALGLAGLVAKGEVTPQGLLEEAIRRCEAVNPQINAIVLEHFDLARKRAAGPLPDGPFKGVPFLLKDLHLLLDGTVTTYGSAAFKGYTADHNSTLTERYLDAGLVIFGKTNSPEFGLSASTEPRLYGPTRNPWAPEHTPGGSSGGAAAAVAARILPLANASDGGGSIRIPASACGLFGMKPTRARTPAGPDRGEGWAGMSISHAVSISVRDSAALLDATTGMAPGDPYCPPAPERPFLEEAKRDPKPLRIAYTTDTWNGTTIDPECRRAVEKTVKLLEDLGHTVEEAMPQIDAFAAAQAQQVIVTSNVLATLRARAATLGREITENDVERVTYLMAEGAKNLIGADYVDATMFIHNLGRLWGTFHETYDVFLSATLGQPPVRIGTLDMMAEDVDSYINSFAQFVPYTGYFNMTGQPSMSVPLHWTDEGLPVGMMFTAAFGNDGLLYRLAGQLERASPWAHHKPPICADGD